jgi:hypothetical protein
MSQYYNVGSIYLMDILWKFKSEKHGSYLLTWGKGNTFECMIHSVKMESEEIKVDSKWANNHARHKEIGCE